ncbi:MAG: hypothetical protein J5879_00685, partial [Clostridia bacterium]|nr:hypothetical protein [Clostridia bacterium]
MIEKAACKLNICGQDSAATLACIVVSSALIMMHCMIAKHFCSCKRKLKQKIKELKEEMEE